MNSSTQTIIHFFLLSLAFGTQLFTPIVSTKLTGVGFYKLATSIVLGALILATGVNYSMTPKPSLNETLGIVFLILSNVMTYFYHKDEKSILMWGLYVLQVLAFSIVVFHHFLFNPAWITFFYLSMMILGISHFAMILGHYYLVVPKLSTEPLIISIYLFWILIFYKMISIVSLLLSEGAGFFVPDTTLGDGYLLNWLFISMRILWGIVAPLILSLFTFKLCRMRSTQSATGILYIIVFFVFIGELISGYLMSKHGLPL